MTTSRAWIESRHLREREDGAAALRGLDALAPPLAARVLERADAVAAQSASLAHAFLPVAVRAASLHAWQAWEETFVAVAGPQAAARELALAFLRLSPSAVVAWNDEQREGWCAEVAALDAASRRVAVAFVEATAVAFGNAAGRGSDSPVTSSDDDAARCSANAVVDIASLHVWSEAATRLIRRGGWRGEFLAEAFLAAGAPLFGRVDIDAVGDWAELVAVLGATSRSPKPPPFPPDLVAATPEVAAAVLRLAAHTAGHDARAAQTLLGETAAAVACLAPADAIALLGACTACRQWSALAEAMVLLGGVLAGIAPDDRSFAMGQATRVAGEAPQCLPAMLRTMDRAIEAGGREGFALWVERGIELAATRGEAAAAHFRLETRTSHKLLVQHSAAVGFEEVDGMLRRYLTMMSRRSFQLAAAPGVWMRPPLVAPEDVALRLPERIDLFGASEDNLALYKAIASHIAGRFEYGTYDFDLAVLRARGWSPPEPAEPSAPGGNAASSRNAEAADAGDDIFGFLARFPNPLLAASLFVLLEGIRIDACLAREFAGLAPELRRLGRLYADTVVPAAQDRHDERLLEALFQMGLAQRDASELEPRLRAQGEFLRAGVELLRSAESDVHDAAALTIALYGGLAFAQARVVEDDEEAGFVDMGGATVVDPFEHLEGGERLENTAPWRPDPSRAESNESAEGLRLRLDDEEDGPQGGGRPLSLAELKALLERGGDLRISEAHGRIEEGLGLFITDLLGKVPAEQLRELREKVAEGDAAAVRAWLARQATGTSFFYDEWDHLLGDYRRRWCRVTEVNGDEDAGEFFTDALARNGELVSRIKRDLQFLRPDQLRRVPRAEQGEEFDLNALVEAHSDRRGRRTPSDRLYVARRPEERDIATLFLIDMSASTDEPLPVAAGGVLAGTAAVAAAQGANPRRVIDLTKDTLVVLAQVLDEIGDAFAIDGFSGHGRASVEIYRIKSFAERLSDSVRGRLGGIAPKRSTRMGAALRHSAEKLARTTARARHLILLSDGFPQDFDYGDDRRSNVHGLRDTTKALREIEKRGMHTFCITVDPAGHDYLGEMCPPSRYAVIDDIQALPSELLRIYRKITRA